MSAPLALPLPSQGTNWVSQTSHPCAVTATEWPRARADYVYSTNTNGTLEFSEVWNEGLASKMTGVPCLPSKRQARLFGQTALLWYAPAEPTWPCTRRHGWQAALYGADAYLASLRGAMLEAALQGTPHGTDAYLASLGGSIVWQAALYGTPLLTPTWPRSKVSWFASSGCHPESDLVPTMRAKMEESVPAPFTSAVSSRKL
eukprot:1157990-Pelagomonas_calceolata.AAC.6